MQYKLKLTVAIIWSIIGFNCVHAEDVLVNTSSDTPVTNINPMSETAPFEQYKNVVDFAFVKEYAIIPRRKDVLIVDSRPARKFDKGHIPVAINISQSQMEENIDKLPNDKNMLIIFYCGGLDCPLSHKAAKQAEAHGYTQLKVYAAGYPDWIKNGGYAGVSAFYVKNAIEKDVATVIDARPPKKFAKGYIPGAINITDTRFEAMSDQLPKDKNRELIVYCGGYDCPLSQKVADKTKSLGYTNVSLYQAGFPDWKTNFGK